MLSGSEASSLVVHPPAFLKNPGSVVVAWEYAHRLGSHEDREGHAGVVIDVGQGRSGRRCRRSRGCGLRRWLRLTGTK
eukprot:scaffold28249_cov14-Prasinocladus_malaysianus.AAC.1